MQTLPNPTLTRRGFVKWSVAAGVGTALVSTGVFGELKTVLPAEAVDGMEGVDRTVWSACTVNCGSRCPVRLQVKDGNIVRVLPDNTGDDTIGNQQIRACVRGRSIRHRHQNPDRLKYPMKRIGKRGEGKFERISWDEAFTIVADNIKRIREKYGSEAIYLNYGTGTLGCVVACSWPPASTPVARLMNCYGGYLNHYGDYSAANIEMAAPATFGGFIGSNSFDDAVNSKLQIMFGNNPLETRMSGGGQTFVTQETKRIRGQKIIHVDPRLSDTDVALSDEWVPIRPGTDAALVAGIAHVLITDKLLQQDFLDKYCLGFDDEHLPDGVPAGSSYKAYVMGQGPDKTEKTPAWAADITGIPADRIRGLARELGAAAPLVHITQGWGPQRHANGENQSRAIMTLACMLGTVGIAGGGTGEREGSVSIPVDRSAYLKPNPVKTAISVFGWTEAIERGHEMTAKRDGVQGADKVSTDIKMIWQYAGNALINQHGDTNRTHKLLEDDKKCEFIVVIDNQMTVSARYADILLPDVSTAEQMDLIPQQSAGALGYLILADKAVDPPFECKPVYEQMAGIAAKLGVERDFTEGRSQEEWVKVVYEATRKKTPDLPDFETMRSQGIFKKNLGTFIGLKKYREDPVANKLKTPSGKIEIFSQAMDKARKEWEFPNAVDGDKITAVPEFVATWEGALEAMKPGAKYPLQVIGHHFKQRTHSTYGNVDWMRDAHRQTIWINPIDASARGIENDDMIELFNDRGRIKLPAKVTPRIAPGVLSVPQGAWYDPKDGVDVGGCVNTLTSWHPTPYAKGNAQHTALVEARKA